MKSKTVSNDRIAIYTPKQDLKTKPIPIGYFTFAKALEYRNLNLGHFVDHCKGLQLRKFGQQPLRRPPSLGTCKTCGSGSFKRICVRCQRDQVVFEQRSENQYL